MQLATKTLEAINRNLEADDGAKFRGLFRDCLPEISDAFNDKPDFLPRTHLGASLIGRECMRQLWYSFRWAAKKKNDGKMIRLFHRGHLEEARFIALSRVSGMTTWHSQDGKQFKISDHGGHYGGSLDGICFGCPDIPEGAYALQEFKTHGKASFKKLTEQGVRLSKPEHYAQCNQYMGKFQLPYTLYMAVEKDTDQLHLEILTFDPANYQIMLDRALSIVSAMEPPPKCNESPAWWGCKFCDFIKVCHYNEAALKVCRTCQFVELRDKATWHCNMHDIDLDKEQQWNGCAMHQMIRGV